MGLAAVLLYYKPDTRCELFQYEFEVSLDDNMQYTNLGIERGETENGGTGGEIRIQAVITLVI